MGLSALCAGTVTRYVGGGGRLPQLCRLTCNVACGAFQRAGPFILSCRTQCRLLVTLFAPAGCAVGTPSRPTLTIGALLFGPCRSRKRPSGFIDLFRKPAFGFIDSPSSCQKPIPVISGQRRSFDLLHFRPRPALPPQAAWWRLLPGSHVDAALSVDTAAPHTMAQSSWAPVTLLPQPRAAGTTGACPPPSPFQ